MGTLVQGMADGSSPLARGTPTCYTTRAPARRLIPARAGNTEARNSSGESGSAHPRSRGEHRRMWLAAVWLSGSSPLARGTRTKTHIRAHTRRLIPARAGNTEVRRKGRVVFAAHPRSRGEHNRTVLSRPAKSGSSPLARGTQNQNGRHRKHERLIPARAGNTVFF